VPADNQAAPASPPWSSPPPPAAAPATPSWGAGAPSAPPAPAPTPSWESGPPAPPAAVGGTIIAPPPQHEATTVIPAWQPPAAPAPGGPETQPILRAQTGAGPQAQLNIESGPDAGNKHRAGETALRVGRSPDNDLILRDPATSGHHARVERRGQQFWIVDLGSTNGTLVNGEPIQEKELNHGDRITIGQNALNFAIVEA